MPDDRGRGGYSLRNLRPAAPSSEDLSRDLPPPLPPPPTVVRPREWGNAIFSSPPVPVPSFPPDELVDPTLVSSSPPFLTPGPHDDVTATSDLPLLLQETVVAGRYRIEEPIGEGGMGRVFRVRHRRLGKSFALKLMRTAFSGDSRARELFYREARLASSLSHPNIVSVIDFGEDPTLGAFMVMELLDGESLSMRLRSEGTFPLKLALDAVHQIAEALHYIHQRQIVHCDIKPDNILLCQVPGTERRKWVVKLLDFGLARIGTGGSRTSAMIDGTPEYMAPERIRGHSPSPSMDIYGLGVLCYELLTGRLPFRGSISQVMEAHIKQAPPPLSKYLKEPIDERAEALVMRALSKSPGERQKDMAAFIYELRTLMDMLGFGRRRAVTQAPRAVVTASDRRTNAARVGFDQSPLPMAGLNLDGTVVVANRSFVLFLTGESDTTVEGTNVRESRLLEVYPEFMGDMRHAHIEGSPSTRILRLRSHDGAPVNLMLWMVPGAENAGDVHVTIHSLGSME
ncbi:MAG: serine/threonine protein kinase [Deltaproteobacteria bacterium]|nr:serine/threonine protein kinase [Deltaproteobacteria bacterium]